MFCAFVCLSLFPLPSLCVCFGTSSCGLFVFVFSISLSFVYLTSLHLLFRTEIIQIMSRCKGIPTSFGLQVLDRKPITISDRVQAFQRYCFASGQAGRDAAVGLYKWRLALTSQFGQAAVVALWGLPIDDEPSSASAPQLMLGNGEELPKASGSPSRRSLTSPKGEGASLGGWTAAMVFRAPRAPNGILTRLRSLVVQNQSLTIVDVRGMFALEVIDLRNNGLEVRGISPNPPICCFTLLSFYVAPTLTSRCHTGLGYCRPEPAPPSASVGSCW